MNKVYRTVWNEHTNTWVAVQETAKARGKSGKSGGSVVSEMGIGGSRFMMTAAASAVLMMSGQAMAAAATDGSAGGSIIFHTGGTSAAVAQGKDSTAIGTNAKVTGDETSAQSSIAFGSNAEVKAAKNAIAFGTGAVSDKNNAISVGNSAKANGQSALAVGDGANAANGQDTAVGVSAAASGNGSSAFGYLTKATGYLSTALGNQAQAQGGSSIAIGKSQAVTENSIAMGNGATANTRTGTIAIGANTAASGTSSVALGTSSQSTAQSTVAIGSAAQATNENAVAIGDQARAMGTGNVSIGQAAGRVVSGTAPASIGNNTVNLGVLAGADSSGNQGQVAIGWLAGRNTTGTFNVASGHQAGQYINGSNNVAIGNQAGKGTAPTTGPNAQPAQIVNLNNTVAIGNAATTNTNNTVAIGNAAKVTGSTPLSGSTVLHGVSGIAIGNNSEINNRNYGIAIGDSAFVGTYANTKPISGVSRVDANRADKSDDAGRPGVAIGWKTQSTGDDSIALGNDSIATGRSSVSLGKAAYAEDTDAIAIGNNARAGQLVGTKGSTSNHNSTAVGSYAQAVNGWNTALGTRSYADASGALAVGTMASAEGQRATALGSYSFAEGLTSTALGYHAIATNKASAGTALGTGTVVDGKESGAWAAAPHGNPATFDAAKRSYVGGTGNYAIGNQNVVGNQTTNSVALGNSIKLGASGATLTSTHPGGQGNSIAPREESVAYTDSKALDSAVAVGHEASVLSNRGVAVGQKAQAAGATGGAIAIGSVYDGPNKREAGQPTVTEGTKAWSNNAIAIGTGAEAGLDKGNRTNTAADKTGAIAIGTRALAYEVSAAALGENAGAFGVNSVALGANSTAENVSGVAVGDKAASKGDNTVAVGANASADGTSAVAVGDTASTHKTATQSMALGNLAKTNDGAVKGVAIGYKAEAAANIEGAVALGAHSIADRNRFAAAATASSAPVLANNEVYVLGIASTADKNAVAATAAKTLSAVSVGNKATGETRQITNVAAGTEDSDAVNVAQLKAVANQITAGGAGGTHYYSVRSGDQSAVSNYNNDGATGTDSLAAGVRTTASARNSIAIGSDAHASGNESLAVGNKVTATELGATAIGNNSEATAVGAQAFGQSSAASGENSAAIGRLAKASGSRASAFGVGNTASGASSLAVGDRSEAIKLQGIAIGKGAKAGTNNAVTTTDADAVAIGTDATAYEKDTVALGNAAKATADSATALGKGTQATANYATAVGLDAKATGNSSVALGSGAQSTAQSALALGNDAQANLEHGVALGSLSKTQVAAGVVGADPLNAGGAKNNAIWTSTHAAVSVGDGTTVTRQITSVAAGTQDTDAVNVAQLKTVANHTKNVGDTIVSVLGGNAAITPEGNISMSNIGGTSKGNIHDAIEAATTKVTSNDQSVAVNHDASTNTYDLAVRTDNATIVKDPATGALKANTTAINTVPAGQPNTGQANVASADAGKLATAGEIAKAINNSGFTLTAAGANGSLVNPGETVDLKSTDGNIVISKTAADNNVSFDLAPIVKIGPSAGGSPITINGNTGSISGLNGNLPVTTSTGTPTTSQAAPASPAVGNAATVGDVLNAGWNLQTGGNAVDFVRPYDTVNFVGANGATVSSTTDGEKTTITIGMNAQSQAESAQLPVVYTDAAGNKVYLVDDPANPGTKVFKPNPDGTGTTVPANQVIASMQSGDGSTTTPTKLANVAPGVNNTDAVNVSQLKGAADALGGGAGINPDGTFKAPSYAITKTDGTTYTPATNVGDALSNLNAEVVKPIAFGGDTGTPFNRTLGSTVNVKGGATGNLTAGNIGVEANGTDTLTIKLAENIDLGASGSVKMGDTTVNNGGLTIANGPSVTKNGIDAGGKQITNLASGGNTDSNGANIGDVKRLAAAADTSARVSAGSAAVTVVPKAPVNGVTEYAVDLSQATKDSLAKADTAVQNVVGDSNIAAQKVGDTVNLSLAPVVNIGPATGGNPVTINGNAGTVGGLTNKTFDPNSFTSGQAATEDQLAQVAAAAGKRNTVSAGSNIVVTPTTANGSTNYQVATNPNMTLTSVTTTDAAGNQTVTNGNGVTITPAAAGKAPVSLTGDGLNNGGNKITNVAAGTAGTDAVNVDQLNQAINNVNVTIPGQLNNRLNGIEGRVNQVENTANAGVAQAIATAGLPQAYLPGKSMVAVGGGYYKGETGYAVGFSTISDGGNWIIKGTASGNSRGHFGASVGAGYQW